MLASFRAYEHHDDRHCTAKAQANYGRTQVQAVMLVVAFVTPDSLLPQETGGKLDYACFFSHPLDIHLDRLHHSTLRTSDIVQHSGIGSIVFRGSD